MENIKNVKVFGNKDDFSIEVGIWVDEEANKDIYNTLKMYINGKNILKYERYDKTMTYLWDTFEGIYEWFLQNLEFIVKEDVFPFEIEGNSAAEKCFNFLQYNEIFSDSIETDELTENYEKLLVLYQDWKFKHSWFTSRRGSILANVFFRRIKNKIEISWNNYYLFEREKVKFIYLQGFYFVEIDKFLYVIMKFLGYCKNLRNNIL